MEEGYRVPGRAYSIEEKKAIIERLYAAWCQTTDLRLGQFLMNASGESSLFYMEDETLCDKAEAFLKQEG